MARNPLRVVVLAGGISAEREVSLGSGQACAHALSRLHPTRLVEVRTAELPAGIDPATEVVFSTLHGTFGEDGSMQRLLEDAGIQYAGCGIESSELTFDKQAAKTVVTEAGGQCPSGMAFEATDKPTVASVMAALGPAVVFKPNRGGSSVGLTICGSPPEVAAALAALTPGEWLVEKRILGREVTVGVLQGQALPAVEIAPKSGIFDYAAKYTRGLTQYLAPAPLEPAQATALQADAERAFAACGCRDYARIDFMITEKNDRFFLEINSLPGMKKTSLFPMGARCAGLNFTQLAGEMISPALDRLSPRASPLHVA